jgi:hypothetical protein
MKELEFRDGTRLVPLHLASLMTGMETYRFTYREAIDLANQNHLKQWLNGQQQQILRRHQQENRDR